MHMIINIIGMCMRIPIHGSGSEIVSVIIGMMMMIILLCCSCSCIIICSFHGASVQTRIIHDCGVRIWSIVAVHNGLLCTAKHASHLDRPPRPAVILLVIVRIRIWIVNQRRGANFHFLILQRSGSVVLVIVTICIVIPSKQITPRSSLIGAGPPPPRKTVVIIAVCYIILFKGRIGIINQWRRSIVFAGLVAITAPTTKCVFQFIRPAASSHGTIYIVVAISGLPSCSLCLLLRYVI
mmetsp:Transcript_1233/g.1982  ORF Transcript_1233/g.1982 Transcript_1233/m.1982 type:complete len:238 (+) Transcript_1233:772-1485(+)